MNWMTRAIGRKILSSADQAMKDPTTRARVEQHRLAMDLATSARSRARSSQPDQDARDALAAGLTEEPAIVDQAIEHLAGTRSNYLSDRAFRLLTAARDHTDVRPIDPALEEQFLAEARLGSLPLDQAFDALYELEPALGEHIRKILGSGTSDLKIIDQIANARLVGIGSRSPHMVLHTDLANEIVNDYVRAQRDPRILEPGTPVFDRKWRSRIHGFVPFKGDTRPKARN